ncbi:O-methyltransferase [Hahella sp. KA22]|uniref:O-methyltransferase n=1 Tax=unclassified Hahella TaxID=2624107 RepID=UPI000FDF0BCB|nr:MULTISPECIES: O-methyltransferase [unclassified Hahella]AZZ93235.1 O-methyltransferase [Hahella sp. KA22]MBU6954998.1 O-methyltransferase [Hahella sp. HN01]QAY56609.1 O-methyltransferase [Hahella sp. KA22]
MSKQTLNMNDSLYQYLQVTGVRESKVLHALRDETNRHEMARMQIAPEQGQFLTLLTKLTGARKAIEVGTFTGYSSICIAEGLPKDGKLICCDVSEEWTSIARRYWCLAGLTDRIDLRLAPAMETLNKLLDEGHARTFDFAFIDADKTNYDNYYEACLRLLRPGGLIAVDNVLWDGKVADPTERDDDTCAIRALNEKLMRDKRIDYSMVPIADGVSLARKK